LLPLQGCSKADEGACVNDSLQQQIASLAGPDSLAAVDSLVATQAGDPFFAAALISLLGSLLLVALFSMRS
jgi:hypothetical protein